MKTHPHVAMLAGFSKYANDAAPRGMIRDLSGMDAAVSGGLAFLVGELEKPDLNVREPLASVTYDGDIPINVGGGWIDFTSNLFVSWGTSGPNLHGIQANRNSNIPIMQADLSKDKFPVFNWQNQLRINWIDLQKLANTPRSFQDLLDKGVRLNWNLAIQEMVYLGLVKVSGGVYGLFNDPSVTAYTAAATGSGSSTLWINKTFQQIQTDITTIMNNVWVANQYAPDGIPDTLGLPPAQWQLLNNTIITVNGYPGGVSILRFMLENNLAVANGRSLRIIPRRQLIGQGASSTDRMVAYINEKRFLEFDIPVPADRVMTQAAIEDAGGVFNTLYAGQLGVVKKLYPDTIAYMDGI